MIFFLSGHSLGGVVAHVVASQYNFIGLILFGSYLNHEGNDNLINYPGAVLTLAGELDGLTRVTRIASEYLEFLQIAQVNGSEYAVGTKPVVILPGVTHSQFASNITIKGDLICAEVTLEEAHKSMGTIVSAFITVQSSNSSTYINEAIDTLSTATQGSQEFIAGFVKSQSLENGSWCITSQQIAVNYQGSSLDIDDQIYGNVVSFAISKPELTTETNGRVHVETTNFNIYAFNPFDVSTSPVSANQISCKLKNQPAIAQALNSTNFGTEAKCKDINLKSTKSCF